MMLRLDEMADVPLIYLVPEAAGLFCGPAGWRRHVPPPVMLLITIVYKPLFYNNILQQPTVRGNKKGGGVSSLLTQQMQQVLLQGLSRSDCALSQYLVYITGHVFDPNTCHT
ncbi:MAG: hypothetical protein OXI96_09130 [Acidimicrobiaceae bacterium]|nr:hypothetical protein [Acidimicrobiaceae bacterium]